MKKKNIYTCILLATLFVSLDYSVLPEFPPMRTALAPTIARVALAWSCALLFNQLLINRGPLARLFLFAIGSSCLLTLGLYFIQMQSGIGPRAFDLAPANFAFVAFPSAAITGLIMTFFEIQAAKVGNLQSVDEPEMD